MSAEPRYRGQRGQQAKPTRDEILAAWARIRSAAGQGSIEASAILIALAEGHPLHLEGCAA